MKKKDRSSADRAFDASLKSAIRLLGPNPQTSVSPTPYPYILFWDRLGRKGQRCRINRQSTKTAQITFDDGYQTVINRQALRRI